MSTYTFTTARWADPEQTTILADSAEFGAVVITERDRPELWTEILASGLPITSFDTPMVLAPTHSDGQVAARTDARANGHSKGRSNRPSNELSDLTILAEALSPKQPPGAMGDGPNLKATPFRAGVLRGTIYDFATAGTELPRHSHDEATVHISVVCQGSVTSVVDGQSHTLSQGDVVAFKPGQEHNLIALEPLSRVVNIVYGR